MTPRLLVPAAAILVLTLAGCTPSAPAPSPPPTSATTEPAPPPSSTPTPTPTADAGPGVRIDVPCATLFDDAAASALVGVTASLVRSETAVPTDLSEVAARQFGALDCQWGGKNMTDSGYDQTIWVQVAPDSAKEYQSTLHSLTSTRALTVHNTAGDGSAYGCTVFKQSPGRSFICDATMLVGTSWSNVHLQGDGPLSLSKATANGRMQKVLATVAGALGTATTAPAWTAPPATSTTSFCTSRKSTAKVVAAWKVSDLSKPTQQDDPTYDAGNISEAGEDYAFCTWQRSGAAAGEKGKTDYLQVEILDGGSWVFPQLVASPPTEYYVGNYSVVAVADADNALLACNGVDCEALIQVGTVALGIGFTDIGKPANLDHLAATVKAIAGS